MPTVQDWVPVSVSKADVLDVSNGRITIRWVLAGNDLPDWTRLFEPYGTRRGSGAYVLSGGNPRVTDTQAITWTVPEEDIEDADSYVKQSVDWTNRQFEGLLSAEGLKAQYERVLAERKDTLQKSAQAQVDDLNA